ncbi:MAG: DUF2283 domain-containing protein [Anaerolineales bacterium]|nr:DUF2283 domain-containing protein [Anaerolineales bacterium]
MKAKFEYDYDRETDLLEVFFADVEANASASLTPDIVLHFDSNTSRAASLILNNFSALVQPDQFGPCTFRVQAERWPSHLRPIVWRILTSPPVNEWLEITSYRPPRVRRSMPLATVKQTHLVSPTA